NYLLDSKDMALFKERSLLNGFKTPCGRCLECLNKESANFIYLLNRVEGRLTLPPPTPPPVPFGRQRFVNM
ncbi:MAG: hypothetical protein LBD41_05425, partial [Clostridiales Family XIII bacterium]|nr:hypothetical protein [Clostridiales Family XIII bacterium]